MRLALLALLLAVAAAVVAHAACEPGYYAYNQSGLFVCVPSVGGNLTPLGVALSFEYLNGTFYVLGAAVNGSHSVFIRVDAPNGTQLWNVTLTVAEGATINESAAIGSHGYVVVSGNVDGYDLGPYAVAELRIASGSAEEIRSAGGVLSILVPMVAVAPLLAAVLRGNHTEAGAGLLALGFFMPAWFYYLGMGLVAVSVLGAVLFTLGFILIAVGRGV